MNNLEFIDWSATADKYGIDKNTKYLRRYTVVCRCSRCDKYFDIKYNRVKQRKYMYCKDCLSNRQSIISKKQWSDQSKRSATSAKYKSDKYHNKFVANARKQWDESAIEMARIASKELLRDKKYVSKHRQSVTSDRYKSIKSIKSREMWKDQEFRTKMAQHYLDPEVRLQQSNNGVKSVSGDNADKYKTDEFRKKCKNAALDKWSDLEYITKHHNSVNSEEYRKLHSNISSKLWKDDEYRAKISNAMRLLWGNDEYRAMIASSMQNIDKVSDVQVILYSILDDLNIKYYREYKDRRDDPECQIGPWLFDCVIPRNGQPDLLIEVQGEYWHSRDDVMKRDKQKSSYIANNFPGQYELKYIWEHEFYNKNKIKELLKYWLGITTEHIIDFDFKDINIRKSAPKEYKLLLSKYHYLPNAGRGGIAYGAYLKDELIAVCVFSPPPRHNLPYNKACEISRLCIHPYYQKKNFGSWFLSKCLKIIRKYNKYNIVLAYSDITFNHTGTIYKASNFKYDGDTNPDYWYVSKDGWVMHKKTLYNRAVKMKMKEKDYADKHGYKKVWGDRKLRYIYCLYQI